MPPPTFSPGEHLSAEKLNRLAAAIYARRLLPTRDRFGRVSWEALVVDGPNPDVPVWPEDCFYSVMIPGCPETLTTGVKPSVGRPAVGRQCKIYPARVGARACFLRMETLEGDPEGRFGIEIAAGGEDDQLGSGDGFRGERLAFAPPCEEDGGGSNGQRANDQMVKVGSGSDFSGGSGGSASASALSASLFTLGDDMNPGDTLRGTFDRSEVQEQLSTADVAAAVIIRVPRATGGALGAKLVGGTWASTLTVKFYTGLLGPFDFATPKTITPAAPVVRFTADDLLGVTAIEVRQSGSADSAGASVVVGGAFGLERPAYPGPAYRVPVQTREVDAARPGDAGSVGGVGGGGGGGGGGPGTPGHGGSVGGSGGGGFATP